MLILQNIPLVPWWVPLSLGVLTVLSAALNVIQLYKSRDAVRWKSSSEANEALAHAAIADRDLARSRRDQLIEENKELANQVAVLKAKTDLNGLEAKITNLVEGMKSEFKLHSEQDLVAAKEHIEAMATVNAALKVLQEQMRK